VSRARSPSQAGWPAIEISNGTATLYFINNGSSPVVVHRIDALVQNPGAIGNVLEPADRLSLSTCSQGRTKGGPIASAKFLPFSVAPGTVHILRLEFPKIVETVSQSWKSDSHILTCLRPFLIDHDGTHETVAPYIKFNPSGGGGDSRDGRGHPYKLL
jgi:hypothetical protein